MSLHDLITWIVGIGALLYFIVAVIKPEWFLYVPPEQRQTAAEQKRLLSNQAAFQVVEQVKQAEGYPVKS